MEMHGEQLVAADRHRTWTALNDPEILKACIPGCEAITPTGENRFDVLMTARVGPVAAKFKGKLELADVKPLESYSIRFDGQGGTAGFGKGLGNVRLEDAGAQTRLVYDVSAQVGGKLAQIGSRLVDAAAKKIASDFFERFNETIGMAPAASQPAAAPHPPGRPASKKVLVAVAVLAVIAFGVWLAS